MVPYKTSKVKSASEIRKMKSRFNHSKLSSSSSNKCLSTSKDGRFSQNYRPKSKLLNNTYSLSCLQSNVPFKLTTSNSQIFEEKRKKNLRSKIGYNKSKTTSKNMANFAAKYLPDTGSYDWSKQNKINKTYNCK